MIGGTLIDAVPVHYPGHPVPVVLLLVTDDTYSDDECMVHVEAADVMPVLGDMVWWADGRVFFDNDNRNLRKVGYSVSLRRRPTPTGSLPRRPDSDHAW